MRRPVVLSGNHAHVRETLSARAEGGDSDEGTERVVQVMKWGLVPSWHKGDPRSFPTLLNNCRYDGMLEKPSFRTAVSRRQRCVVLADGLVNCIFGSICISRKQISWNVIQDNWNVSHILVLIFPSKGVLGLINLPVVLYYFTLKAFSKQIWRLDLGKKKQCL